MRPSTYFLLLLVRLFVRCSRGQPGNDGASPDSPDSGASAPYEKDITILSADFSKRRNSEAIYEISDGKTFFDASNDSNLFLSYPGTIDKSLVYAEHLDAALIHLNGEFVPDNLIVKLFRGVRDRRYFSNEPIIADKNKQGKFKLEGPRKKPNEFLRRLPWFYIDDGCYARAEMVCVWAKDYIPVGPRTLHKIFVFGQPLNISTQFDAKGWHTWGYHVAPVIRSPTQGYLVIDPAMNFDRVLPIREWIENQLGGKTVEEASGNPLIGFVLTNRFGYNPTFWGELDQTTSVFDPRNAFTDPYVFITSKNSLDRFVNNEWKRVIQLGYDPKKLLGERSPWNPIAVGIQPFKANQLPNPPVSNE